MDAALPEKDLIDSADFDFTTVKNLTLSPCARAWIPTRIMLNTLRHLYGQITSRSGLAKIRPWLSGRIRLMLVNNSAPDFQVHAGDQIAKIIHILNQKRCNQSLINRVELHVHLQDLAQLVWEVTHDTSLARNWQTAPSPTTSQGSALHPQPDVTPQMPNMQVRYPVTYSSVPDEFYNYA